MTTAPCGWTGNILRVDLTSGEIWTQPSTEYHLRYIGGRGIGARLAWEEIPPGVGAFDPRNPLMIFAGPLTGTSAPFSGRTIIMGVSPQSYPVEWFSRSNVGGHFGPELKWAGYDGIVITGQAERPCYLLIENARVELRDAGELWGLDTYEAQRRLMTAHGKGIRILTIGPAGERLSRIAIINTETESAAGQGGFGAVMGHKRLKAIVVRGTGKVHIAQPELFRRRCQAIAEEAHAPLGWPGPARLDPEKVVKYGERFHACTQGCTVRCSECRWYDRVPGVVRKGRLYSGQFHCASALFPGVPGTFYDWKLGFEAGFELSTICNEYGLNQWDILFGIVPWLRDCRRAGLLQDLDGIPIDPDDPHFWAELLRKIAHREGIGDALAEGGRRAPDILGFGREFADEYYAAWGYAGHWDGHGNRINEIFFPFWLVPALQWAMDTRDPLSSGHGYAQNIMTWSKHLSPQAGLDWDTIAEVAARVYGSRSAAHIRSGYEDKAFPAFWHGQRSVIKDSLLVDDQIFPRIYSEKTPDHFARALDMDGPSFEYHMFTAATGLDISEAEFERMAERVFNIERAVLVRNYGRDRAMDETVIPYFSKVEWWTNPELGERQALDVERFRRLMDEYYTLRGWDPRTGWPTRRRLEELDLRDIADELERIGRLGPA
jgi:aldehyde:ferredoxin oxidoreductase